MTRKKKMRSVLARAATLALAALFAAVPAVAAPGNIVFLGDSITQGGRYLAGPVPSYRYQLFKNFVDNGADFSPMGTTRGAAGGVNVSALTPDYRGNAFPNVSESAASARSYQYSGHDGNRTAAGPFPRPNPGTAFPPQNRGPVSLKLGLPNPFVKDARARKDSFFDGNVLKKYTGETYASLYGDRKAETLCVMIGINDLYDAWEPPEKILENVRAIVAAYQTDNPKIRVHVFEVLPTGADNGTGTHGKNNYAAYNALLRRSTGKWSKGKSLVTCDDVSQGFYAEDGSMIDTSRGAHPNAQGELVVAGNIARVLGVGQRTAGLPRRAAEALPKNFSREARAKKPTPFTLAVCLKMNATKRADDGLTEILCGNGDGKVGRLLVGERGIYWGDTKKLLYGAPPASAGKNIFADGEKWVRVARKPDDATPGGFYVWFGAQLVGEALDGEDSALSDEHFLIETRGNPAAEIRDLRFDAKKAGAPENERGAR